MSITRSALNLALALLVGTGGSAFAQNCASQNPPLVWKISFTNHAATGATAIFSDGVPPSEPEYVHGVGGVNTVLNVCSGSFDATLSLGGKSTRSLGFQFPPSLTSAPDPAAGWGRFYSKSVGFNIRNLGYGTVTSNQEFTFTTRMQLMFTAPDRATYQLIWQNPGAEADSRLRFPCSTADCVYADALVRVHHLPATSTTPETWIVWPDDTTSPAEVGTLFKQLKGAAGYQAVGQYRLPFMFTIARKP